MMKLGIDIAKAKFDAALLFDNKLKFKAFPNTFDGFQALQRWLQQQVAWIEPCEIRGAARVPKCVPGLLSLPVVG